MAGDKQHKRGSRKLKSVQHSVVFLSVAPEGDRGFGTPSAPTQTPDRSGLGYPLMDALGRFAEAPSDRRRLIAANAWEPPSQIGAVEEFSEEFQQYYQLRERLRFELIRKVISGDLTAAWHPESSTSLEDIPASWWIRASLDCRLNEAVSNGKRVTGLWIREPIKAVEPEAAPSTRDAAEGHKVRQRRLWTDADVEAWFKDRVRQFAGSARHPTADDDWKAAKKEFPGIPRKANSCGDPKFAGMEVPAGPKNTMILERRPAATRHVPSSNFAMAAISGRVRSG